VNLLEHPRVLLLLIAWGIFAGIAITWMARYRLVLMLNLPRSVEQAKSPWRRLWLKEVAFPLFLVVACAFLVAAYAYVPYLILQIAFTCTKCSLGREALWTSGLSSLAPILAYLPHARKARRAYRAFHTMLCPSCGRVNDRPLFSEHHKYFAVCGFAAKMVDGGYACRWCMTPLRFPKTETGRISERR
jgi:hypothetical protein